MKADVTTRPDIGDKQIRLQVHSFESNIYMAPIQENYSEALKLINTQIAVLVPAEWS